ncbi:hypothetical protein [Sphingomonas sp. M1-B02]|uniref:hypothetical protein n=1 Tax=Sphingomonas sp. M1-B02 TaxID=3114300 RepID=UPI00223F37B2|nr:hypothetical protein [Sphingomonas sp. S6-11]UZK65880.1 hypothetical protein OKW87_15425 [Sphingomonas sp. S6-11]
MRIDHLRPKPSIAAPIEIPAELLDSVNRHQANLAALIASLQAAGLQHAMIEASVRTLVDSYASELTAAIQAFAEGSRHD